MLLTRLSIKFAQLSPAELDIVYIEEAIASPENRNEEARLSINKGQEKIYLLRSGIGELFLRPERPIAPLYGKPHVGTGIAFGNLTDTISPPMGAHKGKLNLGSLMHWLGMSGLLAKTGINRQLNDDLPKR
ncbi:F-box domain protein [Aspergillus affinis]|uniref:F-box domain protein n=1 Tax=Aspergillus affinis TaxID=1070780 RepID=UPI0022FF32D5|nr:F-box domain protein [Aspergillus affinis]KAI9039924.1 F-box domain protein [Aspergillus affinis]